MSILRYGRQSQEVSPLRRIATRKHLTFAKLGFIANVSPETLRKLDRLIPEKMQGITLGSIMRVCLALGVSPNDLVPMLKRKVKQIGRHPHIGYKRYIPATGVESEEADRREQTLTGSPASDTPPAKAEETPEADQGDNDDQSFRF